MINDVMNDADAKMGKSVEATREQFAAIPVDDAHLVECREAVRGRAEPSP